jgi:carboxymethylenebutenolidase
MKRTIAFLVVLSLAAVAPAQDFAVKRLEKSPRHGEWQKIKQGKRDVECFVVYPEVKNKATAVIVIHEIFGLSDWVRSVADQLAEAGYIAIAPDFLSGMSPKGGGSKDFGSQEVTKGVMGLNPDQVTADMNAVSDYVIKLPACNGKLTVSGFCWGGGQAYRFATNRKDLKAAFVFYGSFGQNKDNLSKIPCPVYGFYGENDARINMTIPESEKLMKELGKTYEPVTYKGAGHGFMRAGEDPMAAASANGTARNEAWERWKAILKKI